MSSGALSSHRALSDLVSQVDAKITVRKDSTKPYVGLENIPSRGAHLLGWSSASSSISTNSVFQAGDVLFGKLRPNLRKCVVAPFDGYCSTDILVLRSNPGVHPSFAGKVLRTERVGAAAEMTSVGTKMPRTSWRHLSAIEIFCPGHAEQEKIAQILDTLDTAIHETEEIIAKLKDVKQGLMHDLLTRGIDANGELRSPQVEAPQLYRASAAGWVPKQWSVRPLGELGEFMNGLNKPKHAFGSGTNFVNISDVYPDYLDAFALGRVQTTASELNRYLLTPGDIVLDRSSVKLDGVGYPSVFVGHEEPVVFCGFIIRWRANNLRVTVPRYLCLQMRDARFRNEVFKIATGGANINVNQAALKELAVVLPDRSEQEEVINRERALDDRLEFESHALQKLKAEKSGLMDDLLTGRVRVTPLRAKTGEIEAEGSIR